MLTRWLIPAYFIGVGLPWIVGAWIKTGYQPGLVDGDPQPTRDLIDIFCIGISLFDATLVLTVGIGCLVVSIMKGPVRWADGSQGNAGPPQVSLTPTGGGSASRPWGRSAATRQVREPGERERF